MTKFPTEVEPIAKPHSHDVYMPQHSDVFEYCKNANSHVTFFEDCFEIIWLFRGQLH